MALATASRSPNSCESSFRYGVSPHPAHAPENSKSGSRNWRPRTVPKSTRERSAVGSVSKNAMLRRSWASTRLAFVEIDRLVRGVASDRDRTGLHAQAAARAVLDVDLERVSRLRQPGAFGGADLKSGGARPGARSCSSGCGSRCGADERAVAALDAELRLPDRDLVGDVALLVLGRPAWVGAVDRQRADRQLVAAAGHHRRGTSCDELRARAPARSAACRASEVMRAGTARGAARPAHGRPR